MASTTRSNDPATPAGSTGDGSGGAQPPGRLADGQSTLFDWRRRRHRSLRLPIYLLVSVALLSIFFYLFQVTYPTPERTLPRGQEITLLTPTDPAARGILRRITDRTVASALPLAPSPDAIDWGEIAPRLEPSFASHGFHPLDLPELGDQAGLPDLLPAGSLGRPAASLPDLPAVPQPDGLRVPAWRPWAAGGLDGWTVVEAPALQPDGRRAAGLLPIEFSAAVDQHGRVRFLMPLGQGERDLHEQIWQGAGLIRLLPPTGSRDTGSVTGEGVELSLTWGILRWMPEES